MHVSTGYSPEMLVFGKSTRVPGSLSGEDELPSHAKACEETPEGLRFREQLARRETANATCAFGHGALCQGLLELGVICDFMFKFTLTQHCLEDATVTFDPSHLPVCVWRHDCGFDTEALEEAGK